MSKSKIVTIVLGFNAELKPCGAAFTNGKGDKLQDAARQLNFKVYEATSRELVKLAGKLPKGHSNSEAQLIVPVVPQELYTDVVVALVADPKQQIETTDAETLPQPRGFPNSWEGIEPGHLILANEPFDNGWWEALVVASEGAMLLLRYRDFPGLPQFARTRQCIALLHPIA